MNELLENHSKLSAHLGGTFKGAPNAQGQLIETINTHIQSLKMELDQMTAARKKANTLQSAQERALAYANEVKPLFNQIRSHADRLERLVADGYWPLLKYRELLQIK